MAPGSLKVAPGSYKIPVKREPLLRKVAPGSEPVIFPLGTTPSYQFSICKIFNVFIFKVLVVFFKFSLNSFVTLFHTCVLMNI